jgi:hypothetical protein
MGVSSVPQLSEASSAAFRFAVGATRLAALAEALLNGVSSGANRRASRTAQVRLNCLSNSSRLKNRAVGLP